MGAAGSKITTGGRGQIPSLSPYRMPDSLDIQANPMREAMKTEIAAQASRSRLPDQLNEFGDPQAGYMRQRMGEMAERQDVGDELGGMGSAGGVPTALLQAGERRQDYDTVQGQRMSNRADDKIEERAVLRDKMARKKKQARGRMYGE
jgi:hypothetical protein